MPSAGPYPSRTGRSSATICINMPRPRRTAGGLRPRPSAWPPPISAIRWQLSFSVGCFARALGRGGVYLALAAFGPRCLFVLPCTLLLTVQGLSAAARRRDGQKVRLTEGAYWRRVGLCGLILLIWAALELTFGPRLLQWVIARTL